MFMVMCRNLLFSAFSLLFSMKIGRVSWLIEAVHEKNEPSDLAVPSCHGRLKVWLNTQID